MTGFEPLAGRLARFGRRTAVVDQGGSWSYAELDHDAASLAGVLHAGRDAGDRVAILATPGHDFVVALLACWHADAIAVPLHPDHPDAELRSALDDSAAVAIVASRSHRDLAERVASGVRVVGAAEAGAGCRSTPPPKQAAMMIYTSGTTGRPKGVVHTHGSIAAQVDAMAAAWAWSANDRVLLVLPLNHVHGIVNVTLTPLAVGACCEASGRFDPVAVWDRIASGEITVLMAVPTIYARLVATWEGADEPSRRAWSDGTAGVRLMVSGSAALPVSTLERWRQLTGHVLLERYGMTELGMVLSNTLDRRVPGHVGEPFPGVEVRIVDDAGHVVVEGQPGELLVRGPQVFAEYWRRPEDTAAAFIDGWFRTGDVAVHGPGGHRLLGRSSVDIIKTGGEKVSALEIEEVLRTHAAVADCAVVGLADSEWGQRVGAAVVALPGSRVDGDDLRTWGKQRMAAAKVPTRFVFVDDLPRNSLGKVVKADVAGLFL